MTNNTFTKKHIKKIGFFISGIFAFGLLFFLFGLFSNIVPQTTLFGLSIILSLAFIGLWIFLIWKKKLFERLAVSLNLLENILCIAIPAALLGCYAYILLTITNIKSIPVIGEISFSNDLITSPVSWILFGIVSVIALFSLTYIMRWVYAKVTGIILPKSSEIDMQKKNILGVETIFAIGFSIILFIFYTILSATIGLLFHVPINPFWFIIGIVLSLLTTHFTITKNLKKTLVVSIAFLLILFICIGAIGFTSENSFDGNWYHKTAVGVLNLGWNPVYETSGDAIERLGVESIIPTGDAVADVYAKATWVFGSICESLFGNIETGKCYTILGIISLFCIAFCFLCEKTALRKWQVAICSFFLAVNPVTLSQMFTYYNDAFLGLLILIYISCFLYLSRGTEHKYQVCALILIFATACIGMNVKFSGLLFFGIFGAIFYFYWIIRKVKSNGITKSGKWILKLSAFFAALILCSCLLFGSTVYIPNIQNYGNPVYGLIGDTNMAAIDSNMPTELQNLPVPLRFISSILAASSNSLSGSVDSKLPFTFSIDEIFNSAWTDCRIAGWGMMFSGLFLIGIICLALTLVLTWRKDMNLFILASIILFSVIISGTFLTGMWWARYNILPFLISVFPLLFLFTIQNKISAVNTRKSRRITWERAGVFLCLFAIILVSVVNIAPGIGRAVGYEIPVSINDNNNLLSLQKLPDEIYYLEVNTTGDNGTFNGRLFNLYDRRIPYIVNQSLTDYDGTIYSQYPIKYLINQSWI